MADAKALLGGGSEAQGSLVAGLNERITTEGFKTVFEDISDHSPVILSWVKNSVPLSLIGDGV